MTSSIGNNPDYMQYLSSQLPAFPGQASKDGKKADGSVDLSQILAMMGGDPTALAALGGTSDTQEAKGVKPARGTKAATAGQKYTRDAAASYLPPPRAPRVAAGPHTAAAYASLADELQSAQQNAQTRTAQNPATQATDALPWRTSTDATGQQVADNMTAKVSGTLQGLQTFQGDMMTEFMALRVKNGSAGLKELGELSDLATDIQSSQLKEQEAKSREADAEAHKAQAKAAKMGIFSKLMEVIILVITAILAVVTFGAGLPLLAIAAAAAIAFVAAGAAKGAKNGKGFDVMGGLDVASYVADGVMMAFGVGAAMMAIQTASKAAAGGVAKGVTDQMGKGVVEAMQKSGAKVVAENAAKDHAEFVVKTGGEKLVTKETFDAAGQAGFKVANAKKEMDIIKAFEAGTGPKPSKAVAEVGAKVASGALIDNSAEMTAENLMRNLNKQMAKQYLTDAAKLTTKQKASQFAVLFNKAMGTNLGKLGVTGSSKIGSAVLGQDFGTRMMRIGLALGTVQGASALGQGGMQYQTTMHQTNAEEAQAVIKLLDSTVQMMNGQYSTLQSTMQNISESRSKAIDSIQSMLRNDQQVNLMVSSNFVSR